MKNVDSKTVEGFGLEWSLFSQDGLSDDQKTKIFNDYFQIFPWNGLPEHPVGVDVGCGSGRWASVVAPRVGRLHLVDASSAALEVARRNLAEQTNCEFVHASVAELPFDDNTLDFAYSLGVLHHVPDTAAAIASVVSKLRPGAPFLLYLYYALDGRPWWFRAIWKLSDLLRHAISSMPFVIRRLTTNIIAALLYWPLARSAKLLDAIGRLPASWPLSYYRDKSFYVMQTDALDRLGTNLSNASPGKKSLR